MVQLTTDKIAEIYCIADDFCKGFSKEIKKHQIHSDNGKRHRHRSFAMSDAEIITIMICFHYGSFRNLKHFYLFYVAKH
ncbi:MAG: IS982 family transposase, partial [Tannerella sp.]|nr:IS982 family transposase [Tannerella sp.]